MEEELKNIDLIDKYLNQNLDAEELEFFNTQVLKDPNFIKEVELYRMIYAGIERKGEDSLKERLNTYYEEYKNENLPKTDKGKVIKLFVKLSIAASVFLGAYILFNNDNQGLDPVKNGPNIVGTDTTGIQKSKDSIIKKSNEVLVEENNTEKEIIEKRDQGKNLLYEDNSQLSIGGIQKLNKDKIRRIIYPQQLQYSFDGKTLALFGDPLLPALQLQVLKTSTGTYVLKYKNNYYKINQNNSKNNLVKVSQSYSIKKKIDEQINVNVRSIIETSNPLTNLEVLINDDNSSPNYKFIKEDSRLVLSGNLDYSKAYVFSLEQENEITYFLKIENNLYELNSNNQASTQLTKMDILKNNKTRIFRERDSFIKNVYLAN
ncbi:hypothetical protein Q4Q39_02430 [Flavivirga amylovorans]|uniref:FecR protein domain-containing protein n=1 Tax=Flavivirga amylovorans TaxID=870486 RepID=A0ABT8WX38_9FLAO|nr:hypothetical protein [Flavivirga amylovorans]MDO5986250.1 hypothetical protein [Flavivirga amylovorans]